MPDSRWTWLTGRPDGVRRTLWAQLTGRFDARAVLARSAPPAPPPSPDPEGWTDAGDLGSFLDGGATEVMVGGVPVAVVRLGERVHALDGTCPHAGGPLGEGEVVDGSLSCPLHGWAFDLATGRCATRPDEAVTVLPVRVRAGRVEIGAVTV